MQGKHLSFAAIRIGNDVTIGTTAVVMSGVTIGDAAIVWRAWWYPRAIALVRARSGAASRLNCRSGGKRKIRPDAGCASAPAILQVGRATSGSVEKFYTSDLHNPPIFHEIDIGC